MRADAKLLLKADGRTLPLSAKAFDTLLLFLQRRGDVLDKETLMKAVWPDVIVEENNLNQSISAVRRSTWGHPGPAPVCRDHSGSRLSIRSRREGD